MNLVSVIPNLSADNQKCTRCSFRAPESKFSRGPNLSPVKTCGPCLAKQAEKKSAKTNGQGNALKENLLPSGGKQKTRPRAVAYRPLPEREWGGFVKLLKGNGDRPFELTTIVIWILRSKGIVLGARKLSVQLFGTRLGIASCECLSINSQHA